MHYNNDKEIMTSTNNPSNDSCLHLSPSAVSGEGTNSKAGAELDHGGASVASTTILKARPEDILCGRGKPFQNHPGNKKMLTLVAEHKQAYCKEKRERKRVFAEKIVKMINKSGARFLKRVEALSDSSSVHFEIVDQEIAFEKVMHALRSKDRSSEKRKPVKKKMMMRASGAAASSRKLSRQQDILRNSSGSSSVPLNVAACDRTTLQSSSAVGPSSVEQLIASRLALKRAQMLKDASAPSFLAASLISNPKELPTWPMGPQNSYVGYPPRARTMLYDDIFAENIRTARATTLLRAQMTEQLVESMATKVVQSSPTVNSKDQSSSSRNPSLLGLGGLQQFGLLRR